MLAAGAAAFAQPVEEHEGRAVVGWDVEGLVLRVVGVCERLQRVREEQECRGGVQGGRETLRGDVVRVAPFEELSAA